MTFYWANNGGSWSKHPKMTLLKARNGSSWCKKRIEMWRKMSRNWCLFKPLLIKGRNIQKWHYSNPKMKILGVKKGLKIGRKWLQIDVHSCQYSSKIQTSSNDVTQSQKWGFIVSQFMVFLFVKNPIQNDLPLSKKWGFLVQTSRNDVTQSQKWNSWCQKRIETWRKMSPNWRSF